jgi:hypothetical protein
MFPELNTSDPIVEVQTVARRWEVNCCGHERRWCQITLDIAEFWVH